MPSEAVGFEGLPDGFEQASWIPSVHAVQLE